MTVVAWFYLRQHARRAVIARKSRSCGCRGSRCCCCSRVHLRPLSNLPIWSVAEAWFFPKAALARGFRWWDRTPPEGQRWTLRSRSDRRADHVVCLCRRSRPACSRARQAAWRALLLLAPGRRRSQPADLHLIAQIFYVLGLNGTVPGVAGTPARAGLLGADHNAARRGRSEPENAARNIGASAATFATISLPLAAWIMASAIFVFLESLDEFIAELRGARRADLPLLLYIGRRGRQHPDRLDLGADPLVPSIASCSWSSASSRPTCRQGRRCGAVPELRLPGWRTRFVRRPASAPWRAVDASALGWPSAGKTAPGRAGHGGRPPGENQGPARGR